MRQLAVAAEVGRAPVGSSKVIFMRILRIEHEGTASYAEAIDEQHVALLSGPPWAGGQPTNVRVPLAGARLLVPVTPSKIVCVGRNYVAHARELGNDVPREPLLFLKPPSALLAPFGAIVLPPESERVEHEAEIGVVLGTRLTRADPTTAANAIFGLTCLNDVTARDLQRTDVQFTRAKSFDTFCPVGPWVETEFALTDLSIVGRVNGEERQRGRSEQMVFSIAQLLSYMSSVMTLEAGDLIATGTPEGVGPLCPGDRVEVEVSGVGVLQNQVVAR